MHGGRFNPTGPSAPKNRADFASELRRHPAVVAFRNSVKRIHGDVIAWSKKQLDEQVKAIKADIATCSSSFDAAQKDMAAVQAEINRQEKRERLPTATAAGTPVGASSGNGGDSSKQSSVKAVSLSSLYRRFADYNTKAEKLKKRLVMQLCYRMYTTTALVTPTDVQPTYSNLCYIFVTIRVYCPRSMILWMCPCMHTNRYLARMRCTWSRNILIRMISSGSSRPESMRRPMWVG